MNFCNIYLVINHTPTHTLIIMNIFFLHLDPRQSAKYYFNKHCIKIILEIAQLLYSAHWCTDKSVLSLHSTDLQCDPYRKTHFNHPTAKWVRQSRNNYLYACQMGLALCAEYTLRYGKIHKCQVRIEWLLAHPPTAYDTTPISAYLATINVPLGCTPVPLAMPVKYHSPDLLFAYRRYYLFGKTHIPTSTDADRLDRFKRDNTVLATIVVSSP